MLHPVIISCRAETLASIEQAQRLTADRQVTGSRAEFWKLRGLKGNKKNEKNVRQTREDLLQLTIQGKFPAYERVLLREGWCVFNLTYTFDLISLLDWSMFNFNPEFLCFQLISKDPLLFWVLLMILPWINWLERCLMIMKQQVCGASFQ